MVEGVARLDSEARALLIGADDPTLMAAVFTSHIHEILIPNPATIRGFLADSLEFELEEIRSSIVRGLPQFPPLSISHGHISSRDGYIAYSVHSTPRFRGIPSTGYTCSPCFPNTYPPLSRTPPSCCDTPSSPIHDCRTSDPTTHFTYSGGDECNHPSHNHH